MAARLKLFSAIIGFALAVPGAARAQSGPAATQKAAAGAKAAAEKGAPSKFDAHDITGIWNMSFPQGATEPELEIYVSQFGKEEPPMTAWAKERFDKTKPAFGKRGVLVAKTNDPAFQCFPPGVPRIYLHPFPVQIVETPKELMMIFEYDHNVRHIYKDRKHPADLTASY